MFFKLLILLLVSFISRHELVSGEKDATLYPSGPPDYCLGGPVFGPYLHKPAPSREAEPLEECGAWQDLSCCSADFALGMKTDGLEKIYQFYWDNLCRKLSPQCERFIKNEACFYMCEPMLGYYQTNSSTGDFKDVPICADYCEAWFQACKDDLTCVENWLEELEFHDTLGPKCPKGTSCVTFQEMYGSAKGLCGKLFGDSYFYESDEKSCAVMAFDPDGGNPNIAGLLIETSAATPAIDHLPVAATVGLMLLVAVVFALQ